MRTVLVLPQNDLIWKFMKGLHGFIFNWTFLSFLDAYEKNPCKKKKDGKNCFEEQKIPWTYLKIFWKKQKNFKAIWGVLGHSKLKFSPSPNHGGRHFFETLPSNLFSTATALDLKNTIKSWRTYEGMETFLSIMKRWENGFYLNFLIWLGRKC